ncbi:MAG: NAD-dependent epimerase [Gammaproteobacteria bacterium]
MRILVTGCAGFIGYHLTKKLLETGNEVIGLDSLNEYYDVNLKLGRLKNLGIVDVDNEKSSIFENFKFHLVNIHNKEQLNFIFNKYSFDAVCNLAAQAGVRYSLTNPYSYLESNIDGFLNILECCRSSDVTNLSYASSSSVYGLNENYPFSVKDNVDHPISLYAATKKSNELMAHTYSHLFNIRTTGLRFFTVYGPWGRPDMALFKFTRAALEGKEIEVFNNGEMERDFTYIDDIVAGVVEVIKNPAKTDNSWEANNPNPETSSAPYRVYNIGNNNPVQLMEFISTLEDELKLTIKKKFLPIQQGDVKKTYANIDSLEEEFGYRPQTSIREGISQFVSWYRSFYGK